MKNWSHIYWLLWFILGFGVPEAYGLWSKEFDTLSATFKWFRDFLPTWASVLISGAAGGVLLWLLTVHWIFSGLDRPGFDLAERLAVTLGVALGVLGAVVSRPRKKP